MPARSVPASARSFCCCNFEPVQRKVKAMRYETVFGAVITAVVLQRFLELRLAKRNAAHVKKLGGQEIGAEHYRAIVALHASFFLSLFVEFMLRHPAPQPWMWFPAAAFLLLQALRVWCIWSLGVFWNTRIYVVPGMTRIVRGPYRYLRHPNYAVVTMEMLTLPLLFQCWVTALAYPLLNIMVLRRRIAAEEAALEAYAAPAP